MYFMITMDTEGDNPWDANGRQILKSVIDDIKRRLDKCTS
jgi:hypothetical protein